MTSQATDAPKPPGPKYEAPTLTFVGLVSEVVQSGGGKLSVDSPDGPDTRKPPGK